MAGKAVARLWRSPSADPPCSPLRRFCGGGGPVEEPPRAEAASGGALVVGAPAQAAAASGDRGCAGGADSTAAGTCGTPEAALAPLACASPRGLAALGGRTAPCLQGSSPRRAAACDSSGGSGVNAVRRELEHLEARLSTQIARVREIASSSLEKTDRQREAALERLDKKVFAHESLMSKIDRKISELVGAVRGLSDETQVQLRRADAVDSRLWGFRHQIEEEFRQKFLELENNQQEVLSKCRIFSAEAEDTHKRIGQSVKRLGATVHEQSDLLQQGLANMQLRLDKIESAGRNAHGAHVPDPIVSAREEVRDTSYARIPKIELQLLEVMEQMERLKLEVDGDGSLSSRIEEHEVRLAALRSKLDSQDKHSSDLDDFVHQQWEARFEQLHKSTKDAICRSLQNKEEVLVLARRIDGADRAIQELCEELGHSIPVHLDHGDEGDGGNALHKPAACHGAPASDPEDVAVGKELGRPVVHHGVHEPDFQDSGDLQPLSSEERELAAKVDGLLAELRPARLIIPKFLEHDRHISGLLAAAVDLEELPGRVAALEGALMGQLASSGTDALVGDRLDEVHRALSQEGLSNLLFPNSGVASIASKAACTVCDSLCHGAMSPTLSLEDDLTCLFQRVDEGESRCTELQQQLHGSMVNMDRLLEKVAGEVPGGSAGSTSLVVGALTDEGDVACGAQDGKACDIESI